MKLDEDSLRTLKPELLTLVTGTSGEESMAVSGKDAVVFGVVGADERLG